MFINTLNYIKKRFDIDINKNIIDISSTNRNTLAELFNELGFKIGAEIGVERGIYSKAILRRNPQLKLYSIDAWTKYSNYRHIVSQDKFDFLYEETKKRLAPYNCEIIKEFSLDAINRFKDNSLDFVYIDANHEFKYVVDDISEWSKKVRKGGIVSGHDYIKRKNPNFLCHVVQAVNGYVNAYHIKPLFIFGRKAVKEGELRDRPRSWMFIKK